MSGGSFTKYRGYRFTNKEKTAEVAPIMILVCNFLPSLLPKDLWLTVFWAQFNMAAVFAAALMKDPANGVNDAFTSVIFEFPHNNGALYRMIESKKIDEMMKARPNMLLNYSQSR